METILERLAARRDRLTLACGIAGLVGAATATVADIAAAIMVADAGMVADTISELAAGRGALVMDTALVVLAAGMAAVAVGLYRLRPGGWRWTTAVVVLAAVAAIIAAIALFNEYDDGDPFDDWTFHYRLVYALGFGFTFVPLLTARALASVDDRLRLGSYAIAVAWLIMGPLLFVVPTGWDGLFERCTAALMVLWLVGASLLLVRQPPMLRRQA